ncbi:prephenate dehydrogenase [Roseomonas marmotae]|uniref:Prephenate dehydrogenase n=1 Tax=Roseomonas marmotae TaxID=2768161 RepID=A0ABS3KFH5_9PROT|nr:prephenate dehydrogenase [Roseomonas marmotae]MBO1076222.1 prephenate dehydrogenase [Roseomonas marmotae]QTI77893.1 prephenate dehydrogenase [Roseomonas marmotae]
MFDLADIATLPRPDRARPRPSLGLIGCGAFGAFILPHLERTFDVLVHDPARDAADLPGTTAGLAGVGKQEIVVLAVPLAQMRAVATAIAPHLRPGTLVVDVCSVKVAPLAVLEEVLPPHVDILGTHPLFGPQSGKNGIAGLRIALCPGRDRARARLAKRFLQRAFGLEVVVTTPEEHDRQMAYVQGLTHIISRIVLAMDVPPLELRTTTFDHLTRMVDTVRHDSEALFRTIARDNPFAAEVRERFAEATGEVLERLRPT